MSFLSLLVNIKSLIFLAPKEDSSVPGTGVGGGAEVVVGVWGPYITIWLLQSILKQGY